MHKQEFSSKELPQYKHICNHHQGEKKQGYQTCSELHDGTQGLILVPWDHDLSQRQTFNQLSHPGAH